MSRKGQLGRVALFAITTLSAACMPEPPLRDAGDSAFVREVVPALLGRQPRNAEEVHLFSDLITGLATPADGRRGFMRGLMQTPEFRDRWSEFLLRYGEVDRDSATLAACYGTPTRAPSATLNSSLAHTSASVNPGENVFNGVDVLNSMFKHPDSDISTFLRLNLFTTQAGHGPGENEQTIAARVQQTYIDRNLDCMGCHNSLWATTASGSGWKRHYPMAGFFEKALYGDHDGPDTATSVTQIFRTSQASTPVPCVGAGCADSEQPWASLSRSCGDFVARVSIPASPNPIHFGTLSTVNASTWNLEAMLKSGVDHMRNGWLTRTVGPGDQLCTNCPVGQFQAIVTETCMSCHNPTRAPSLGVFYFVPGTTAEAMQVQPPGSPAPAPIPIRNFINTINAMVQSTDPDIYMPPTNIPSADRDNIRNVVAAFKAETDNPAPNCACSTTGTARTVAPTDAFAFLSAANVVNGAWKELFGRTLTVPNHFPRTSAQSAALEFLSQRMVHDNWSLRAFLERVYLGKYYNRVAPKTWTPGLELVEHFEVPPTLDPWQQMDRRVNRNPDAIGYNNAMTEGIRRKPVRTLVQAVSAALGWPAPTTFPTGAAHDLHQSLGDHLSTSVPGAVDADMQNMLAWEAYAGTCRNPSVPSDWITTMVNAGVAAGATREQAIIALKDRLISEPWLDDATEISQLTGLFGSLSATLVASDIDLLRGVCGVLVHSPQFMLQGLVPQGDHAPATPSLLVCAAGEPCTYKQHCDAWVPFFDAAGYTLTCPAVEMSVKAALSDKLARATLTPKLRLKIEQLPTLCTNGVCGFLKQKAGDQSCQRDPSQCVPVDVMSCDTRCSGMFCCGESLQDIDYAFAKGETGLLYTVAEGCKVARAENVLLITKGGEQQKLQPGSVLRADTILRVFPGSILQAEGPYGKIATPEKGIQFDNKQQYVDVLIGRINKLDDKQAAADDEEYHASFVPSDDHQWSVYKKLHFSQWQPGYSSDAPPTRDPKGDELRKQQELRARQARLAEEEQILEKLWAEQAAQRAEAEADAKNQQPVITQPINKNVIVAPMPKSVP